MVRTLYKWLAPIAIPVLLFLVFGSFTKRGVEPAHPFFVCVVEINHNATDKTLEITCKIFIDDFQKTLGKLNNKVSIDLINPKDKVSVNAMVGEYVKNHLSIKADGKQVNLQYLGYEISEEAAWSYFQVDNIPSVKKIDVVTSLLHDYTDKQVNIIHVIVGGERKSTKLDYPNTVANFSF